MSLPRLLDRSPQRSPRVLNENHIFLDKTLQNGTQVLSDPYSLTALALSPLFGKIVQSTAAPVLQSYSLSRFTSFAAQGMSKGLGFGAEVLGFESVHRGLRVYVGNAEPRLLSKEEFLKGLSLSASHFFIFKTSAGLAGPHSYLLSHFAGDAAMVLGDRLQNNSQGSLVMDFVKADAMHWQLKAGLSAFHVSFPSLAIQSRALDLHAFENPRPLPTLQVKKNPLVAAMQSEAVFAKIPHDQIPKDKIGSMGKLPDVICNRMLGDGNVVGLGVWAIGQERPVLIRNPGVKIELPEAQYRRQAQESAQLQFRANPVPEKFATALRGAAKEGSESELKFVGSMPGLNDTIYRFSREGDTLVIVQRDGAPKLRVLHEGEILKGKTIRVQEGDIVEMDGIAPFVFSASLWLGVSPLPLPNGNAVKASSGIVGDLIFPKELSASSIKPASAYLESLAAAEVPQHFKDALGEILAERVGVKTVSEGDLHYILSRRTGIEGDSIYIFPLISSCPIQVLRANQSHALEVDPKEGLALKEGDTLIIGSQLITYLPQYW